MNPSKLMSFILIGVFSSAFSLQAAVTLKSLEAESSALMDKIEKAAEGWADDGFGSPENIYFLDEIKATANNYLGYISSKMSDSENIATALDALMKASTNVLATIRLFLNLKNNIKLSDIEPTMKKAKEAVNDMEAKVKHLDSVYLFNFGKRDARTASKALSKLLGSLLWYFEWAQAKQEASSN